MKVTDYIPALKKYIIRKYEVDPYDQTFTDQIDLNEHEDFKGISNEGLFEEFQVSNQYTQMQVIN